MGEPYYADDSVTLYLGDCRDVIPALDLTADLIVADPPYGETSLPWDRWPSGWPDLAATVAASMWCFGSMRMFLDRYGEFAAWKLSQDVIWQKHNATGPDADRFRRVHEHAPPADPENVHRLVEQAKAEIAGRGPKEVGT